MIKFYTESLYALDPSNVTINSNTYIGCVAILCLGSSESCLVTALDFDDPLENGRALNVIFKDNCKIGYLKKWADDVIKNYRVITSSSNWTSLDVYNKKTISISIEENGNDVTQAFSSGGFLYLRN